MDLVETANQFKQKGQFMNYFEETTEQRDTDFMSKFYSGRD